MKPAQPLWRLTVLEPGSLSTRLVEVPPNEVQQAVAAFEAADQGVVKIEAPNGDVVFDSSARLEKARSVAEAQQRLGRVLAANAESLGKLGDYWRSSLEHSADDARARSRNRSLSSKERREARQQADLGDYVAGREPKGCLIVVGTGILALLLGLTAV